MVLLITAHQIISQTFHSNEVRGVIPCGPVEAATGSVEITCFDCGLEFLPIEHVLPQGCG